MTPIPIPEIDREFYLLYGQTSDGREVAVMRQMFSAKIVIGNIGEMVYLNGW